MLLIEVSGELQLWVDDDPVCIETNCLDGHACFPRLLFAQGQLGGQPGDDQRKGALHTPHCFG